MIEKFDCITGTTVGTSSKGTFVNLSGGKNGLEKPIFPMGFRWYVLCQELKKTVLCS